MLLKAIGVAAILVCQPANAQDGALIFGVGAGSCATWLHDHEFEGEAWVLGFFSGANTSRFVAVGDSTDARGIIESVRIRCEADPAARLSNVTSDVYLAIAERERQ